MSDVVERFTRYVQISTASSDEHCDQVPSTHRQFNLANLLATELRGLGAQDVCVSEHCYVTAQVPASAGAEDRPHLGLIAHMDTSEAAPGEGVKPHIVHYEGGPLICGKVNGAPVQMLPEKMPALADVVGQDLICSDGTTLLGADDKAGIAEIMSLLVRLRENPELPHPGLGICFCPDEEIGHGAELLDVPAFGCDYAYTVDGGPLGELEWECFNACDAVVTAEGYSIHPGDAKGRMVNALNLIHTFHDMLPSSERPENTEGYEGFFHLQSLSGTVTHATARYILRDHDTIKFNQKIKLMERAAEFINASCGQNRVHVEIKQSYKNMASEVLKHPQLITLAKQAFENAGVTPNIIPIRGGTDGAQLSFRGLPCPNLSTGGYCAHGVNEFIPVRSLEVMVDVLQELVAGFAA